MNRSSQPKTMVQVIIQNFLESWHNDNPPFEDVIHPRIGTAKYSLITNRTDVLSKCNERGFTIAPHVSRGKKYYMVIFPSREDANLVVLEFGLGLGKAY